MIPFSSPFPPSVGFSVLAATNGTEHELLSNLHPQERSILRPTASPKRRLEFSLGRMAARHALAQLGITNRPAIGSGEKGMPLWPDGIVGSITHAAGSAIAVAAHDREAWALGIDLQDLERGRRVDISKMICHDSELPWIEALPEQRHERLLSLFSAKESIYKALFPVCRRYISFKDVQLLWDEQRSEFDARLVVNLSQILPEGFCFTVGCTVKEGFVLSYVLLKR